mgnify:CR=1 FL=1
MATGELTTILEPRALPDFVETHYIKNVTRRALAYVKAGFPLHFRGTTGTGKTTLAMHIAGIIGRPVIMLHGDEEFSTSDLVGAEYGFHSKRLVDNFIHTVLKTEEDMTRKWADNRLTVACKHGFTLIYDEFTRSRPEANNVLLSILQERMMDLPPGNGNGDYLKVDPNFTAIFTSNPEDYAGVHRSQDALRDRMVTIDLGYLDRETEIAIVRAKSGLATKDVTKIVNIVRELRDSAECEFSPTVRGCIMIAKTLKVINGNEVAAGNKLFREICQDVLTSETSRVGSAGSQRKVKELVNSLIDKHC